MLLQTWHRAAAEAHYGEDFIRVIKLQHAAHSINRSLILVHARGRVTIVQRCGQRRVTVGASEIDRDLRAHIPDIGITKLIHVCKDHQTWQLR